MLNLKFSLQLFESKSSQNQTVMRRVLTTLLVVGSLFIQQLSAQENTDSGRWPNGLTAKILAIDYGTPNDMDDLDISNGLEVAYVRNLSRMFNFAIPAKVGLANITTNNNKATIFSIDAIAQLQFYKEGRRLIPYLFAGSGVVFEKDEGSNVQIPIGVGINLRVNDGGYLSLQGEYRKSLEADRDNIQLGIGWHFKISANASKKDTDGDGIMDDEDKCPEIPGVASGNGCPDLDGDGITDYADNCPEVSGKKKFDGCPDADGDDVPDNMDDCPNEAGVESNFGCPEKPKDTDGDGIPDVTDKCPEAAGTLMGCPDTDGDGVANKFDDCPNVAGSKDLDGCPDKDGDGVIDKDDLCPTLPGRFSGCPDTDNDGTHDGFDKCLTEKGPGSNGGCPDIKIEDRQTLEYAAKAIRFETGRADLKQESFQILEQIINVMGRYPNYRLKISGYTDNVGNAANNQRLSESRARACYDYLSTRSISTSKMDYAGYGESFPIGDNNTAAGRKLNRRTEFQLIFE
ncbi:MAG: OOP family OmpA-OmpF porin [Paraglaciecola sp.]|jgi:OOP family OmpA-OmpF porin